MIVAPLVAVAVVTPLIMSTPAHTTSPHSAATGPAAQAEVVTEDVTFRNGAVELHGTVVAPAAGGSSLPGLVLVPGSGTVPRQFYRPHAEAFARAGIVALIYDKRTEGYSLFQASITDLADDAIAGARVLRQRDDVDPGLVGLHGHSEGAWTVVVAANRSPAVSFVVTSAGSALSSARTQVWMNRTHLRHAGVRESLLWPLGENLTRHVVAAGMFRLAGHDPLAQLERLDQPLLALFAEHDRSTPPGESLRLFRQARDRGGHDHHTLRVIDDANHLMGPSGDGFDIDPARIEAELADLAPEYVDTVTAWVHGLADGPPASSADPPPHQVQRSSPLTPLGPLEALWVQLVVLGLLGLAFVSYPVTALVGRLRSSPDRSPTRRSARTVFTLGLVTPVLALGYLGFLMVTAALALGPVVLGRPLAWLLLQVATAATAAAGAVLVLQWWQHRHEISRRGTLRVATLAAGIAVFVPWAAYWGLFTV